MKLFNMLDDILGEKGKLKVLRCLAFSSELLTGREISRRVCLTPWACIKILRELENLGLVEVERAGKSHFYRIKKNFINGNRKKKFHLQN